MNLESLLAGPGGLIVLLVLVVIGVNVFSYALLSQVKSLVTSALQEGDGFAGDETVATYTKLLFGEVMRGSFFTPSTAVSGNRANDRICRSVERSADFARIKDQASWVRNLPPPLHLVPYCV
jgi:hypothetical protein